MSIPCGPTAPRRPGLPGGPDKPGGPGGPCMARNVSTVKRRFRLSRSNDAIKGKTKRTPQENPLPRFSYTIMAHLDIVLINDTCHCHHLH